ncbi:hypothetical protein LZ32DRAFT_48061 [Colletotrichum eremochloae]|nr:hypothetical protein LZ32DRAFT_48061 [Colletotrichum eremochloae]
MARQYLTRLLLPRSSVSSLHGGVSSWPMVWLICSLRQFKGASSGQQERQGDVRQYHISTTSSTIDYLGMSLPGLVRPHAEARHARGTKPGKPCRRGRTSDGTAAGTELGEIAPPGQPCFVFGLPVSGTRLDARPPWMGCKTR